MHRLICRAVVLIMTLALLLSFANAAQIAQLSVEEVTDYSASERFIDTRFGSDDLPDFCCGGAIPSVIPVHDGVAAQKAFRVLRVWPSHHFIRGPPAIAAFSGC